MDEDAILAALSHRYRSPEKVADRLSGRTGWTAD
jgi:hypothetical protein